MNFKDFQMLTDFFQHIEDNFTRRDIIKLFGQDYNDLANLFVYGNYSFIQVLKELKSEQLKALFEYYNSLYNFK